MIKLYNDIMELSINEEKRTYYDDPDDPPVPKCSDVIFQFNECDNYMTLNGLVKGDLNYMIEKVNKLFRYYEKPRRHIEYALDKSSDLPPEDYFWYVCPLDRNVHLVQGNYYFDWCYYNTMDKVPREEISIVLKMEEEEIFTELSRLKDDYDLTGFDIIWGVVGAKYGCNFQDFIETV
jgi:hypothetical protein